MGDPARPLPEVAPEILRVAQDLGRPAAAVPFSEDLGHLPGESGFFAGVKTVFHMLRNGEAYLTSLVRKHGSVFRHMIGPSPAVFVADPDLIWIIARNEQKTWSAALAWTFFFGGLRPGHAGGPLNLELDSHRDARRLLTPAFGSPAIAGYLADAQEIYDETITAWLRRGRVKLKPEVRRLFARVSARIFMGFHEPADAEWLDRSMSDGWNAVLALRKRSRLSPGWRRAQRGTDALWDRLLPLVAERKSSKGTDLFTRLCQTPDEASWLDDDARIKIFIGTMFGAFDTTASGTASMGYLLAKHPEWQDRVRKEALAVAGRPGPDELKTLDQMERCWKETLRLYPVAAQLVRQSLCEQQLGARRIPAAAFVWALVGSAQRDPKFWTDPERFDPDRFSPERAEDKRHKAIYLPFGAGAHACVGAQLAGAEIKAFWHALLTRCRIRLTRDYQGRHLYTPVGMVSGDVELTLERL